MGEITDPELSQTRFEDDRRSFADLWSEAQQKFTSIAGDEHVKFGSTQDVLSFFDTQVVKFQNFRHDQGKVDRLRTLFSSNMEYVEAGTKALASAVKDVFPPAAVIGSGLAFVFGACKQVSADYNLVVEFFGDMNIILERIRIIETRIPASEPYHNCLVDVFGAILEMCAHAGKSIKSGRLKKWLFKALSLDDSDLAGSKKKIEAALDRLREATRFAILGNTEKIQEMTRELQQNQERSDELLKKQTQLIESGFQSMSADLQKIILMLQMQNSRANVTIATGKDEVATMRKVENFLNYNLTALDTFLNEARDFFVPGTCQWLFEEPAWKAWVSRDGSSSNFLAISGNRGCGKTHLAITVFEHLCSLARSSADGHRVCVGRVLFRNRVSGLQDMYSAMAAITVQIAQQDAAICERINAQMARQDRGGAVSNWNDIWIKHILTHFQHGSPHHLQLIVDGLDELLPPQLEECIKFLDEVNRNSLVQISILMFCRPEYLSRCQTIMPRLMVLQTHKQNGDYRAIIQNRISSSRSLRRWDDEVKQKIVQRLEDCSDSILYVEYILRNLKMFERKSSLLKQLNAAMPPDLDHIYLDLANDYKRRLTAQQLPAARIIFMWVAFALVHPKLTEITALLQHTGHQEFQIEEELQNSQLRRFFIMRTGDRQDNSSSAYRDHQFEVVQENDEDVEHLDVIPLVHFWDRSMREFFQSLTGHEAGLRTVKSEAHRLIFITCSEVLRSPSGRQSDLLNYASEYWLAHHASVCFDDHSHEEQVEFLEATALLLHESSDLPNNLIEAEIDFLQIREHLSSDSDVLVSITRCAEQTTSRHLSDLSPSARAWFESVKVDSQNVLLSVAQGLIRCWFRTEDFMQMYKPYWYVRSCVIVAGLPPFDAASPRKSDLRGLHKDSYMRSSESRVRYKEIKKILKLLPGELSFDDYTVLYKTMTDRVDNIEAALHALGKLVDAIPEDERSMLKAGIIIGVAAEQIAQVIDVDEDPDSDLRKEAVEMISDCVKDDSMPPVLRILGWATLANIHFQFGELPNCLTAHAEVRKVTGTNLIDARTIKNEVKRMRSYQTEEETSDLIKGWRSEQVLAYMTSDFYKRGTEHMELRRNAAAVSDRQFLVNRYLDVIQVLERVHSAAPIQIELATCYQTVYNNFPAAKETLNQVLDNSASGDSYLLTNEEPERTLGQAINKMSDILYEEFRTTANPELKMKVYQTTKELLSRKLATHISISASALLHHTITLARMLKRLGPAQEFQSTIEQAFKICCESLVDTIGWNDRESLVNLCKILALMNGFEDEMAISMSARFSDLNGSEQLDINDDSSSEDSFTDSESEDDEPEQEEAEKEKPEKDDPGNAESEVRNPEDDKSQPEEPDAQQGDLTNEPCSCDGSICSPNDPFTSFKEAVMYDCLICSSCFLCQQCYEKRQEWNKAEAENDEPKKAVNAKTPTFCGLNHKYIAGPMAGWKGVRQGVIYIDGREPVKFVDWLKELKDEKWPKAWERFWLDEGVAG